MKNHQHQIDAYSLPGTPYVRHKWYVRVQIFVRIPQVNLWYLYIPHIFVYIYCALAYSAWCQLVPGWYQLVIPLTPVVIRAHTTTNLHELKMALDAGRGGWRCKQRASTDAVGAEIGGALVAFEGQSSTHTHQHTNTQGK